MNSNVGESIAYAWLRRVKGCAFVNMNWRPITDDKKLSDTTQKLDEYAEDAVRKFCEEYFKGCKLSWSLGLVQTEIDAVGISLGSDSNQNKLEFHVVEIECHDHETGQGAECFPVKVLKKFLRAAICLSEVVSNRHVDIYFITQSIAKKHTEKTKYAKDVASSFFTAYMPNFEAHLIYGDEFTTTIFEPLIKRERLEHGNKEFYKFYSFFSDQDAKLKEK